MSEPLFLSLDSARLASEIAGAQKTVCYAAPGILREPAVALAELAGKIDPEFITVCLDFDERVMGWVSARSMLYRPYEEWESRFARRRVYGLD